MNAEHKPRTISDSFYVEEAYNWCDDIMEITQRIVHETDEARLSNIAEHFEVDVSEIREFLEMKQQRKRKPITNGDKIRRMSDEELAKFIGSVEIKPYMRCQHCEWDSCVECCLDWLKQEAEI